MPSVQLTAPDTGIVIRYSGLAVTVNRKDMLPVAAESLTDNILA